LLLANGLGECNKNCYLCSASGAIGCKRVFKHGKVIAEGKNPVELVDQKSVMMWSSRRGTMDMLTCEEPFFKRLTK
jgi:hypothetical protein